MSTEHSSTASTEQNIAGAGRGRSRNLTTFAAKRKARRFAMQGLYEWQMTQNPVYEIEARTRSENAMHKVDLVYYHELLTGSIAQVEKIDALCLPLLDRAAQALNGVERAILRLGAFELLARIEVPYKIVLDEAIELAKDFGATDSYKYINAVLDGVAKQIRLIEIEAMQQS